MWNDQVLDKNRRHLIKICSRFDWNSVEFIDMRIWSKEYDKPTFKGFCMRRERIINEFIPALMKVLGIKEWKAPESD